jgi:uncharacterized membrane protein
MARNVKRIGSYVIIAIGGAITAFGALLEGIVYVNMLNCIGQPNKYIETPHFCPTYHAIMTNDLSFLLIGIAILVVGMVSYFVTSAQSSAPDQIGTVELKREQS